MGAKAYGGLAVSSSKPSLCGIAQGTSTKVGLERGMVDTEQWVAR